MIIILFLVLLHGSKEVFVTQYSEILQVVLSVGCKTENR